MALRFINGFLNVCKKRS